MRTRTHPLNRSTVLHHYVAIHAHIFCVCVPRFVGAGESGSVRLLGSRARTVVEDFKKVN